jgi:hypothetical protein
VGGKGDNSNSVGGNGGAVGCNGGVGSGRHGKQQAAQREKERGSDDARREEKRREGRRRDKGLTLNLLAYLIKRSPLYEEVYNC